ncbi:MAG: ATP phosphoribosyltransferase regulatory subunit [Synergistaceae bacterium]|nr:ATP phosphoribosyltransferase regulatory subunit [Synergistaceae bacterium]
MNNNLRLRPEEKAALSLRELYADKGCSFYRMSRFEEYDFYADKKDFLTSRNILTFTDINGRLMALRPDVTLSIIKHVRDIPGQVQKFFYDEKVYRVPRNSQSFHEISQAGIEFIGSLDEKNICEVIELALESLHSVSHGRRCVLDIADAGLIAKLIPEHNKRGILKCIAEKNIHELRALNAPEEIIKLMSPDLSLQEVLSPVIFDSLKKYHDEIHADYSVINISSLNYYNGLIFRGFIEGIPESILSGGQYDNLLHMMGHDKDSKAIGFAVYLDLLDLSERN